MVAESNVSGIKYDYIEIGTSDFETLVDQYNDKNVSLSIDPLQIYLDRLPDKKNNTKVNVAVSDKNSKTKVYYIEPEKIVEHNLPFGFRGCNSIEKKHPTVETWLNERNLNHIVCEKDIECISFQELVNRYNIIDVDYLKIDTEGHDFNIIRSMLETHIRPKKISFEANALYSEEDITSIVNLLQKNGYNVYYRTNEDICVKLKDAVLDGEITFIVPTIGRESLSRCISSILNQTNPDWKCKIIFDGIPIIETIKYNDNEYSLVDDKRFHLMTTDKLGNILSKDQYSGGTAGLVRNIGLLETDTKWIGFVDDDDTISPTYVELLKTKYSNYDVVIWRMQYTFGKVLPEIHTHNIESCHVGISFCYQNKFENILFDQNDGLEDFLLLVKLLNKTNDYIITPEVMYNVGH